MRVEIQVPGSRMRSSYMRAKVGKPSVPAAPYSKLLHIPTSGAVGFDA